MSARVGLPTGQAGLAAGALGLAALEAFTPAADGEAPINPKVGDLASATSGGTLFAQNCLRCHGPQGKGDGPEGVRLPSQPLDLTASRTRSLRDGDIDFPSRLFSRLPLAVPVLRPFVHTALRLLGRRARTHWHISEIQCGGRAPEA